MNSWWPAALASPPTQQSGATNGEERPDQSRSGRSVGGLLGEWTPNFKECGSSSEAAPSPEASPCSSAVADDGASTLSRVSAPASATSSTRPPPAKRGSSMFFGIEPDELPIHVRLRAEPKPPAEPEVPTLLGGFPSEEALQERSRSDPGDVFKTLRQWARGLAVSDLSDAGAQLEPGLRREVFRFLVRMCSRRFYSAQSRELLSSLVCLEPWTQDHVVDAEAVARALGGALPERHTLPLPPAPRAPEQVEVAGTDEGACASSMHRPTESVDSWEGRSTTLPGTEDGLDEPRGAATITSFGAGSGSGGAWASPSPFSAEDGLDEPRGAATFASFGAGSGSGGAWASPSPFSAEDPQAAPSEPCLDKVPQALREKPGSLAEFPPLEAFTDLVRHDAADTFKHFRRWFRQSSPWDLAAVADWLEDEQRRHVMQFLTRICEERRLYQAQSRELLTHLLSIKEWVRGDSVVDEEAIAESFYHTGMTPQCAWTPVMSRQSTSEFSIASLAGSGSDDAPAFRIPQVLQSPGTVQSHPLTSLGEDDKEETTSDSGGAGGLGGGALFAPTLSAPRGEGKASKAATSCECAGPGDGDLLTVACIMVFVGVGLVALNAVRRRG